MTAKITNEYGGGKLMSSEHLDDLDIAYSRLREVADSIQEKTDMEMLEEYHKEFMILRKKLKDQNVDVDNLLKEVK